MTLSVTELRANIKWLKDREKEYPHRCRTKKYRPTPEQVKLKLPDLNFISAPLTKESEWGFKTEADMLKFKRAYTTNDNKRTTK